MKIHFKKITLPFFILLLCITSQGSADVPSAIRTDQVTNRMNSVSKQISEKHEKEYKEERELIMGQLQIITGNEETRYIIVPGDTITISFKDRSEMKKAVYQVSATGEIHLPLIGAMKVSGLNRKGARERISIALKEYIRRPEVNIAINNVGRFTVLGAGGPGSFNLTSNLTLMDAILKAGFDRDKTNLKSVIVMRGGVNDPVVLRLNLYKMIHKGDRTDNILVKPGDLIYLPTSFISHVETFKDNMLGLLTDYYLLGGQTPINETKVNQDPTN